MTSGHAAIAAVITWSTYEDGGFRGGAEFEARREPVGDGMPGVFHQDEGRKAELGLGACVDRADIGSGEEAQARRSLGNRTGGTG
jgi:hypothetical protein